MSKFEDRLWREIVQEHGARLAEMTRPAADHRRRPRPRLLAGTTVGLAGVGTAVALIVGAAGSSPAFAVSRNNDGTVTVWIKRIDGIAGANARLAALGVRARAVAVAAGCKPPPGVTVKTGRLLAAPKVHGNWTGARQIAIARFDPKRIPSGRTLLLPAIRDEQKVHIAQVRTVHGAAPSCLAAFAPPEIKAIVAARTAAASAGKCRVVAPEWPMIIKRPKIQVRIMKLERGRILTRVQHTGTIRIQRPSGKVVQVPAPPALIAAKTAARLRCVPTAKSTKPATAAKHP